MKKITLLGFLILLLMILTIPKSFAQVEKYSTDDYIFTVVVSKKNSDGDYTFYKKYELTGIELIKVNNIGKMLRTLTFRLSENDIMELANPSVRFSVKKVTGDFDGNGVMETIDGQYTVLTRNGNLKLVYHSL